MQRLTPRASELLALAVFAFTLRAIVAVLAMRMGHISLAKYTSKADTTSYIANAAVMCGERTFGSLDDYDLRVFPGYPALIAVVHKLGFSLPLSALLVTWLSAGVAAALAAKAFDDIRIGWAMTCLIPHYLINSSLGMSEAPLLMAVCAAVLLWRMDRFALAGTIFAFAGMVRPMACFAVAGVLLAMMIDGKWQGLVWLCGAMLLTFALEVIGYQWWTGDALRGMHVYARHPGAYNGHLLSWPFQSLLTTPAIDHADVGRMVYIWIHVVLTFAICGLSVWHLRRRDARNWLAVPWVVLNTAFVLCIGSVWGFRHFPRFTIPAAPAMFWTVRQLLPRWAGWWVLIAGGCAAMAVGGVIDSP